MTLLMLLLPMLALTAPNDLRLPEPGRYTYSGQFEVLQKRMTEAVRLTTKEGRDRAKALRQEGYACTHAGNGLARCVGFVSAAGAENEIRDRVKKLMENEVLEFGVREGEPSPGVGGETYQEWNIHQAGSFHGTHFNGYRYQILTDGPHKMLFDSVGVVVEEEGFSFVTNVHQQQNRNQMATYLIGAKLR